MKQIWMAGILVLACVVVGGCRTESERLADMADRTVQMQSQQNTTISKTSEELAKLNRDIQTERQYLNERERGLEQERQAIHRERRSELAWAESFQFLAIVIAAIMPLFLCAFLIWAATRQTTNFEAVNEILIQELVSPNSRLITGRNVPAIENKSETESGVSSTQTNNEGN